MATLLLPDNFSNVSRILCCIQELNEGRKRAMWIAFLSAVRLLPLSALGIILISLGKSNDSRWYCGGNGTQQSQTLYGQKAVDNCFDLERIQKNWSNETDVSPGRISPPKEGRQWPLDHLSVWGIVRSALEGEKTVRVFRCLDNHVKLPLFLCFWSLGNTRAKQRSHLHFASKAATGSKAEERNDFT